VRYAIWNDRLTFGSRAENHFEAVQPLALRIACNMSNEGSVNGHCVTRSNKRFRIVKAATRAFVIARESA
jgi:hypothetical protein